MTSPRSTRAPRKRACNWSAWLSAKLWPLCCRRSAGISLGHLIPWRKQRPSLLSSSARRLEKPWRARLLPLPRKRRQPHRVRRRLHLGLGNFSVDSIQVCARAIPCRVMYRLGSRCILGSSVIRLNIRICVYIQSRKYSYISYILYIYLCSWATLAPKPKDERGERRRSCDQRARDADANGFRCWGVGGSRQRQNRCQNQVRWRSCHFGAPG